MSLCLEELGILGAHGVAFVIDLVDAGLEGGDPSLVANGAHEVEEAYEKLQECADNQNFIERAALLASVAVLIAAAVAL